MKRPVTLLYHTLLAGVALSGCLLMESCGSDSQRWAEPACEEPAAPTYTLSLQIMTGAGMTRADDGLWGDTYENDFGTFFDSKIESLALFFVADDRGVTRFYAVKDSGSSANIYTCQVNDKTPGVTMSADKKSVTFNGKIMALANLQDGSVPVTSASDWLDSQIPFSIGFGPSSSWSIPMWGIETFNKTLTPNETTRLGDIHLLRSVSKLVVKLDPSLEKDYTLDSIEMAEGSALYYSAGYALPGDDPLEKGSTKNIGIRQCFNPRTEAEALPTAPVWKYNVKNNAEADLINGAYTYVSESQTDFDTPFKFTIKLKSRQPELLADFAGTLYFAKYDVYHPSETAEYITRAVRNHEYEFTISLAEQKLQTAVRVWEFGGEVHIDM